ncbi:hypothetical protein [Pseudoclavibacter sp. AY1H1]|uniref:hypothetical protein n=1 Tax=Pseudoclavibacter sp. AY1H1 TaxID=2080584 RepID=UPI000CE86E51|nr:hypothetical protein [Pseudoclavibacter sp. AY1H1]PPF32628.1 hypothetical protein C5E05_19175 [Pseudoclavibacter sp. AY1H1]
MSTQAGHDITRVARFYTKSRRYPKMIGHAGGARIPGGPYSFAQAIGAALTIALAWVTQNAWAPNTIVALFGAAVAGALVGFALRYLPVTNLNPMLLISAGAHAVFTHQTGTYKGVKFRLKPPRPVPTRSLAQPRRKAAGLQLAEPAVELSAPTVAEARTPLVEPLLEEQPPVVDASPTASEAQPPRALTGVERLLAQTSSH